MDILSSSISQQNKDNIQIQIYLFKISHCEVYIHIFYFTGPVRG